jgi:hypothetical protein
MVFAVVLRVPFKSKLEKSRILPLCKAAKKLQFLSVSDSLILLRVFRVTQPPKVPYTRCKRGILGGSGLGRRGDYISRIVSGSVMRRRN